MPADCRACGRIELEPANVEAWELYLTYPGLIKMGMDGSSIDYQSALRVIDEEGYADPLGVLRQLEAIRQGLCERTKSK